MNLGGPIHLHTFFFFFLIGLGRPLGPPNRYDNPNGVVICMPQRGMHLRNIFSSCRFGLFTPGSCMHPFQGCYTSPEGMCIRLMRVPMRIRIRVNRRLNLRLKFWPVSIRFKFKFAAGVGNYPKLCDVYVSFIWDRSLNHT